MIKVNVEIDNKSWHKKIKKPQKYFKQKLKKISKINKSRFGHTVPSGPTISAPIHDIQLGLSKPLVRSFQPVELVCEEESEEPDYTTCRYASHNIYIYISNFG